MWDSHLYVLCPGVAGRSGELGPGRVLGTSPTWVDESGSSSCMVVRCIDVDEGGYRKAALEFSFAEGPHRVWVDLGHIGPLNGSRLVMTPLAMADNLSLRGCRAQAYPARQPSAYVQLRRTSRPARSVPHTSRPST